LGQLLGEVPGADGGEMTEEQFVQRVVDATHDTFEVDASGSISFEGQPLARLVRGKDRRSPLIALTEPEVWTGGARQRLERRLLALARDLVTEAMGGFPAEALTGAGRSAPMRGLAYRLAEGLGVITQGEAHEQWRLLDDEEREHLRALGVREGQRFLYVAEALAPQALERRCMLTALFQRSPVPKGVPREPVLELTELGGWNARALGYAVLGSVALRLDLVERLSEVLRHPHGTQKAHTFLQELRLEGGVRARVLRELGGQSGRPPMKRRRRRRGGKGPGAAPDTRGAEGTPAHAGSHPKPRRSGAGEGGAQGEGRRGGPPQ
jgi:ATP-dependent RNA helicase SUPV3L1/SUV3